MVKPVKKNWFVLVATVAAGFGMLGSAKAQDNGSGLLPPTNLRVGGVWVAAARRGTDVLHWDPVPGAIAYNVYQYDDRIAANVTGTSFQVPTAVFTSGLTYTVTAVDAEGNESIPSNLTGARGASDPSRSLSTASLVTPTNVRATAEWNADEPRISLAWQGHSNNFSYNIYRNGVKVAEGLWGLVYIDTDVHPGQTYSYAVTGASGPNNAPGESALSAVATAAAPLGPPAVDSLGQVKITGIIPNDDSATITFSAVPGAVDYRAYNTAKPGIYKYSAGGLSIEMNGIDIYSGADIVVEAVDKMGPYQKMDGVFGPGAMDHVGNINMAINGHGDPSNMPIVLARSVPTHVTTTPFQLTGEQAFFDTFRNSQPFVAGPVQDQAVRSVNGGSNSDRYLREFQNDKWLIRTFWTDQLNTSIFVMSNHFMDTVYDGNTPREGGPLHITRGSLVMMPKAIADISGGKVLHVTFEVDPHFTSRRWCDVIVAAAGDSVVEPNRALGDTTLTASGNVFRWRIEEREHKAEMGRRDASGNLVQQQLITRTSSTLRTVRTAADQDATFNSTFRSLDKRSRFDLYLSSNRFRIYEKGKLVYDRTLPAPLPFNRASVSFVHQVYHTGLQRQEDIRNYPERAYWYNHRPYADERHWDNMGFEVLSGFPQ